MGSKRPAALRIPLAECQIQKSNFVTRAVSTRQNAIRPPETSTPVCVERQDTLTTI